MLGDKITGLRKNKNLTQKQLSKELGTAQSTIGMIERNERGASNDLLIKLSKYFNVTIDYLLSTEEELKVANDTIDKIGMMAERALNYPLSVSEINKSIETILENFRYDTFTEEESNEIVNFINYVISKRGK